MRNERTCSLQNKHADWHVVSSVSLSKYSGSTCPFLLFVCWCLVGFSLRLFSLYLSPSFTGCLLLWIIAIFLDSHRIISSFCLVFFYFSFLNTLKIGNKQFWVFHITSNRMCKCAAPTAEGMYMLKGEQQRFLTPWGSIRSQVKNNTCFLVIKPLITIGQKS